MNEYFEYDYNSYSSDEYPESGNHIIDNHTNNFEEESNEFIDVIEEISIFNDYDPISYAKTFIHEYCNYMGISEEGMCVMNQQYLTWLIGSSQLLEFVPLANSASLLNIKPNSYHLKNGIFVTPFNITSSNTTLSTS